MARTIVHRPAHVRAQGRGRVQRALLDRGREHAGRGRRGGVADGGARPVPGRRSHAVPRDAGARVARVPPALPQRRPLGSA